MTGIVLKSGMTFIIQGAQIFEAVGIDQEVIDLCFIGSASRIGGVTFKVLAQEVSVMSTKIAPLMFQLTSPFTLCI